MQGVSYTGAGSQRYGQELSTDYCLPTNLD